MGEVDREIPLRSVLGPLFWNLWFNPVLDALVSGEVYVIICYADDNLIIVGGIS